MHFPHFLGLKSALFAHPLVVGIQKEEKGRERKGRECRGDPRIAPTLFRNDKPKFIAKKSANPRPSFLAGSADLIRVKILQKVKRKELVGEKF